MLRFSIYAGPKHFRQRLTCSLALDSKLATAVYCARFCIAAKINKTHKYLKSQAFLTAAHDQILLSGGKHIQHTSGPFLNELGKVQT
jgi:hypothetical protein